MILNWKLSIAYVSAKRTASQRTISFLLRRLGTNQALELWYAVFHDPEDCGCFLVDFVEASVEASVTADRGIDVEIPLE